MVIPAPKKMYACRLPVETIEHLQEMAWKHRTRQTEILAAILKDKKAVEEVARKLGQRP